MDCIKNLIAPHVAEISKQKNINAAIVYKMFDIIRKFMDDVVNMKFGGPDSKVALVGGIMINCDGEGTDMFVGAPASAGGTFTLTESGADGSAVGTLQAALKALGTIDGIDLNDSGTTAKIEDLTI